MGSNKKLYVLAGSAQEAADFAREHAIPFNTILYLSSDRNIKGLQNPAYVVTGTFWQRKDAPDIWNSVQLCMRSPMEMLIPVSAAAKAVKNAKTTPPIAPHDSSHEPVLDHGTRFKRIVTPRDC